MAAISSGFSLMVQNVGSKVHQFYRKPRDNGTQKNGFNENRYSKTPSAIDASGKPWLIRKTLLAKHGVSEK